MEKKTEEAKSGGKVARDTMKARMPQSVESIAVVDSDDTGRDVQYIQYRKKKKKKKSTLGFRETERMVRRFAKAQQAFLDSYLSRHDKSSRKKRDGWFVDSPKNVFRATQKGLKKLF